MWSDDCCDWDECAADCEAALAAAEAALAAVTLRDIAITAPTAAVPTPTTSGTVGTDGELDGGEAVGTDEELVGGKAGAILMMNVSVFTGSVLPFVSTAKNFRVVVDVNAGSVSGLGPLALDVVGSVPSVV